MNLQCPPLASLIPHAGAMCLLDEVTLFEPARIVCRASSHRLPDNPLRQDGQLPVTAGIEYAAQAVAVHGSLLARQSGGPSTPRQGMIAVLTDVHWHTDRLDTLDGDLAVQAEKLGDLPQGLHYRFRVSTADRDWLAGELIIALQTGEGL